MRFRKSIIIQIWWLIMANPQKENGYTGIANEIIEALSKIRIPGEQWQILLVIFRKTYGWNKKEDSISLSQFMDATGINRQNVCRAIRELLSKKIIDVIKKDNGITEYRLQKDFEIWKPLSKKITLSKKIIDVIKKDNGNAKIVIKKDTHKTTSNIKQIKEYTPQVKFLVDEYFKTLDENQQKRFEKYRSDFHDCCDKLIRVDGHSEEEIRKAVNFARNDYFWGPNFLSFSKLRQKNKEGMPYIEVFLSKAGFKKQSKPAIGDTPNLTPAEIEDYYRDDLDRSKP